MNCAELEELICDYADGTLTAARKADVESHLEACPACAEVARDSAAAVAFMERAADVEPPPELITRILFDAPWTRKAPAKGRGPLGQLSKLIAPILQPRFAMGMAMTVLSLAMVGRFSGIQVRQLKPSDLDPVKVWMAAEDRVHRTWERGVKYYESLRLVFEVQTRLKEWSAEEGNAQPASVAPETK